MCRPMAALWGKRIRGQASGICPDASGLCAATRSLPRLRWIRHLRARSAGAPSMAPGNAEFFSLAPARQALLNPHAALRHQRPETPSLGRLRLFPPLRFRALRSGSSPASMIPEHRVAGAKARRSLCPEAGPIRRAYGPGLPDPVGSVSPLAVWALGAGARRARAQALLDRRRQAALRIVAGELPEEHATQPLLPRVCGSSKLQKVLPL